MKIAVVGVGLIGGSMMLKLRQRALASYVFGIDKNERHLQQALQLAEKKSFIFSCWDDPNLHS